MRYTNIEVFLLLLRLRKETITSIMDTSYQYLLLLHVPPSPTNPELHSHAFFPSSISTHWALASQSAGIVHSEKDEREN